MTSHAYYERVTSSARSLMSSCMSTSFTEHKKVIPLTQHTFSDEIFRRRFCKQRSSGIPR